MPTVETSTPPGTPTPIGPYNHIARVGSFITIGGTAGFDPATGKLAGPEVTAQTLRILESFQTMLKSAGSDLDHVVHINIFLKDMSDFDAMNRRLCAGHGRTQTCAHRHRRGGIAEARHQVDDEFDCGDGGVVRVVAVSWPVAL